MPKETILVIEDEQLSRELVHKVLTRQGYEVILAASGQEGLQQIARSRPDLVILDVMMPGIDGYEVCRQLRADPRTETLPIIMLSARGQVDDKVTGLEAGADEYVTKPIALAELVARVQALLARTQRLLQRAGPTARTMSFAFIGAKGGVGTTTVALNVAAALGSNEQPAVIAEIMPSLGSLALMLDQQPFRNISSLLRLEAEEIDDQVVRMHLGTITPAIKVLFSPQKLSEFSTVRSEQAQAIHAALARLSSHVILDLSNVPNTSASSLVPRMDFTAIVVEPEPVSVGAAKTQLELVRAWGGGLGATGVIIVNRSSLATPISFQDVGARIGGEVIGVIPQAAQAFLIANQAGKPLLLNQPDSAAAASFREIAQRLVSAS